MPASWVIRILELIIAERSKPKVIYMDNGPERLALQFQHWVKKYGIKLIYTKAAKPVQNAYIVWFNLTFPEDVLDIYWFESLSEATRLSYQ